MIISTEQKENFIEYCRDFIREFNQSIVYRNISCNITSFLEKSPSLENAPNGVCGKSFLPQSINISCPSIMNYKKTFFYYSLNTQKYIVRDFLSKFRKYKNSFGDKWQIQHAVINLFPYSQVIGNCEEKSILLAKKISDKTHNLFPLNAHFYLVYGNNFDHVFILAQLTSEDTLSLENPDTCFNTISQNKDYFLIIDPWLNNVFSLDKAPYYWKDMLENDDSIRKIGKIFNLIKNGEPSSLAIHDIIFNYLKLNIFKKIDITYNNKVDNIIFYLKTNEQEMLDFKTHFSVEIRDMEEFNKKYLIKIDERDETKDKAEEKTQAVTLKM